MKNLKIIFLGTPEFAVPSLQILLENRFNVVAVITAPDKPQGRGQTMAPPPVKVVALQHHIPVLQPTNLKSLEFIDTLKTFQADLQVVVAFRMLPEAVWSMPPMGTINLHASLLPQYRGAAPINWAIIRGERETGVTTFLLQHEIDTGRIIFQDREPIFEADDAGSLYTRLMNRGSKLVLKTVAAIAANDFPSLPQEPVAELKAAPKIFRETCEINWNQPSKSLQNFVRGLSPYPAAWTVLQGKTFKVYRIQNAPDPAAQAPGTPDVTPGTVRTDNKDYLYIKTSDGWVAVEELQPEGKRRIQIRDFFRGNRLGVG